VIARTGIGVDLVDIPEASKRSIAVVNVPDGATKSTAEHALMLMMAAAKNLKQAEARLRSGEKDSYKKNTAIELFGKTLGLAGFGRIGQHVAQVAMHGLGMKVIAYDPYLRTEVAQERGVRLTMSLFDMLAEADVVSIHTPLTEETRGMIDAKAFAAMKKGSIFINAARGGLVREDALLDALKSDHLFGAGLDVTDPEPPHLDNPLLRMDNVIVTPHVASGTFSGKRGNFEGALRQALQVLKGEKPTNLLNPEVWEELLKRLS
jgi:D-3-phosphoglycerate dehydrogenase